MEQEISGISKFPEKRTTSRGEPKFSKQISRKFPFYLILNRNFRKYWSNGTLPVCLENYLAVNTWILNGSSIECLEKKYQPFSLAGV